MVEEASLWVEVSVSSVCCASWSLCEEGCCSKQFEMLRVGLVFCRYRPGGFGDNNRPGQDQQKKT